MNATDEIKKMRQIINEEESRAEYYIHSEENRSEYIKTLNKTLIEIKM